MASAEFSSFIDMFSKQLEIIKKLIEGRYPTDDADIILRAVIQTKEIQTLIQMNARRDRRFSVNGQRFSAQQFGERWNRLVQSRGFQFILQNNRDNEILPDSDSDTESEDDDEMSASASSASSASSGTKWELGDVFRQKNQTGDAGVWIIISVIDMMYTGPGAGRPGYTLLSLTGSFVILSDLALGFDDSEAEFMYDSNLTRITPLERFRVSDNRLQEQIGEQSWDEVRDAIKSARAAARAESDLAEQRRIAESRRIDQALDEMFGDQRSPAPKRKADRQVARSTKRRTAPTNRNTTNLDNADLVQAIRSKASNDEAAEATFTMLEQVTIRFSQQLDQRSIGRDRIPQRSGDPKYSLGDIFRVNGITFIIVAGGLVGGKTFYYDVRPNRRYKGPFVISEYFVRNILGKARRSSKAIDDVLDSFDLSPELKQKIIMQYENVGEDADVDDGDESGEALQQAAAMLKLYQNADRIFLNRDYFRTYTAKVVQAIDAMKLAERTGAPKPPPPPFDYMLGDQFHVNDFVPEDWLLIGGGELPADGAAGSGEMFFDFISNKGNLLRCKKSEIASILGFRDRSLMKSRGPSNTLSKYNLGTSQLDGFIEDQKVTYQAYIRERLTEIYEGNLAESNKTEIDFLTEGMPFLDWRFFRGVKPREEDGSRLPTEGQRSAENNRKFRTPKGMSPSMFEQMLNDQQRRAEAYKSLYDITDQTDITAIDAQILLDAQGEDCSFCGDSVTSKYEQDPVGKPEFLGKPVKLKCGHWYHINCLMKCQTPQFTNYNYNNGFGDILKPIDTLKCILCRRVALDNSFGDGVYRVKLRF